MRVTFKYNGRSNTPVIGHPPLVAVDQRAASSASEHTKDHRAEKQTSADVHGDSKTTECGSVLERFEPFHPSNSTEGDRWLALGSSSEVIAVHIKPAGLEWWEVMAETMGGCESATVDAGDEWYILFRCQPERRSVGGQLADGVRLISEGHTIKLPPSRDSRGDYCCWLSEDTRVADLPGWIVSLLSVPSIA